MSEPHSEQWNIGESLERDRDQALRAMRPLPPEDEMLFDDLTEDEDRQFMAAILNA